MDKESWKVAEEHRVRKLQQIRQLLSIALGPDVDLNQEAKNPHCAMERNRGNGKKPRQWKLGRLNLVLHCNACCAKYHEICDGILDIEDEKRPSKK